jgi:ElaA protein
MRLTWTLGRLEQLSPLDVYELLALRSEVFVVEQVCIFQDADGVDRQAHHLLGRDESGHLLALLRIVDPGVKYGEPSIGRVISAPAVRQSGVGRDLMAQGIRHCRALWPGQGIRISSQARLEGFYRGFGFQTVTEPYLEDDIPHVEMLLKPEHST